MPPAQRERADTSDSCVSTLAELPRNGPSLDELLRDGDDGDDQERGERLIFTTGVPDHVIETDRGRPPACEGRFKVRLPLNPHMAAAPNWEPRDNIRAGQIDIKRHRKMCFPK